MIKHQGLCIHQHKTLEAVHTANCLVTSYVVACCKEKSKNKSIQGCWIEFNVQVSTGTLVRYVHSTLAKQKQNYTRKGQQAQTEGRSLIGCTRCIY